MIQPLSSSTAPTPTTSSSSNNTNSNQTMQTLFQNNSQTFLKLLVAQLKNQNPTNPVSGTQFIAQTEQLAMVQTLNTMSSQQSQTLSTDQTLASTNLIGKQVTALTHSGSKIMGTVQSVQITSTGPILSIAGQNIPLSAVQEVM